MFQIPEVAPGGQANGHSSTQQQMIASVVALFDEFERNGLSAYLDRWRALDFLAGRPVQVESAGERIEGIAQGVAEDGALRVRTARGERLFHGGEVSVRAAS